MGLRDDIVRANRSYAGSFEQGQLPSEPRLRLAVVTCMDARMDPARFLGLEEGDAHVIRNAGGVVTEDVLRSLAVSHWLLGTEKAYVIAHTDCGLGKATDESIRARLRPTVGPDVDSVEFLTFGDLEAAVRRSVRAIRESPLLPPNFRAVGWVYDVKTGSLRALD